MEWIVSALCGAKSACAFFKFENVNQSIWNALRASMSKKFPNWRKLRLPSATAETPSLRKYQPSSIWNFFAHSWALIDAPKVFHIGWSIFSTFEKMYSPYSDQVQLGHILYSYYILLWLHFTLTGFIYYLYKAADTSHKMYDACHCRWNGKNCSDRPVGAIDVRLWISAQKVYHVCGVAGGRVMM